MKSFYNKKMTIQESASTGGQDEWGSGARSWSNVSTLVNVPCKFSWLHGMARGERMVNNRVAWIRDAKVYCAYHSNLTTAMRMVYDSNNYEIVDLSNVGEKDKFMTIYIKKMV